MALNVSQGTDDFTHKDNKVAIDFQTLQQWCQQAVEWAQTAWCDRVRMETLRSLPQFLGISAAPAASLCFAPHAFGPPVKHLDKSTLEKIKSRLALNGAFFLTNYVLVVLTVALVVALMHPTLLVMAGVLYGLWALHGAWGLYEVQVFGVDLQPFLSHGIRQRALTVLTVLVIAWKALWPFVYSSVISALFILAHAFLRDPKHIDLSDAASSRMDEDAESGTGALHHHGETTGLMSESAVFVERPHGAAGLSPSASTSPTRSRIAS